MTTYLNIPRTGQQLVIRENGKRVRVKVYKANKDHVTLEREDKRLWSMTLKTFHELAEAAR